MSKEGGARLGRDPKHHISSTLHNEVLPAYGPGGRLLKREFLFEATSRIFSLGHGLIQSEGPM